MLLEFGKISQDSVNPLASSIGRSIWISAAQTVVVILSHSCLVVLWTAPFPSQSPAKASTQRKNRSSVSQMELGVTDISN